MKIAIDCSQIIYGTGVSTYVENLVKNLLLVDKENEYILFGGSLRRINDLRLMVNGLRGNFKRKIFPIPPTIADLIWNRLHILPIEALIGKVDVFHSSDWSQPPTSAFKVTAVHDLAPVLFPDLGGRDFIRNVSEAHKARLEWVKKEVDRIIVPSNSTKSDLIDFGILEKKIVVIYEGVDEVFKQRSKETVENLKRKYRISGDYILAVGVGLRKNTDNIISAFEKVRPGKDLKLVVAGGTDQISETRGVVYTGYISNEEKATLYSGAETLVYPSIYEGFGLPILEAFACKCPVVTSDVSSMPEVAGNAAVLVDPSSVDSIAEGIKKALDNKKGLVEKGIKRAKEFSWQKAAEETLEVYREAASLLTKK